MSELRCVFIDGETKTGKGAASKQIAATLEAQGAKVYYDVAGDFYRRYVALVRQELALSEAQSLPAQAELEAAAQRVYARGDLFDTHTDLGDLQRPSISNSVSVLGELHVAQEAATEWWVAVARKAADQGATVLVVDGRNPRKRLFEQSHGPDIQLYTLLDLYMTCEPKEAARRTLFGQTVVRPTLTQLQAETANVTSRRHRDRQRAENPFLVPQVYEEFIPGKLPASSVVAMAWQDHDATPLPVTILLDNTHIPMTKMLAAVSELAVAALQHDVIVPTIT